jgi:solute:Na+ symporter, SSS family
MITTYIIFGYLALLLLLGFASSRYFRGTTADYFVASRGIGPFLLLMSLFGTTMTAFALMGSTGAAYAGGIGIYGKLASASGIVHTLCFFVIGVKIWRLGAKNGYMTQIQFFRDRFQSDKIGLILFPCLVGLVIPYLLLGIIGAGNTFASASENRISFELGAAIICIVVLVYVFFGGARGTAWANCFQTLVFIALGIVTFCVISKKLGGPVAATQAVEQMHPGKLQRSVPRVEQVQYEIALKLFNEDQAATAELNAAIATSSTSTNSAVTNSTVTNATSARATSTNRLIGTSAETNAAPAGRGQGRAAEVEVDEGEQAARVAPTLAPKKPKGLSQLVFLTYMLIPLSVGMFPHIFQHWLTAKSANSFKLPVIVHPLLIMIVWVPCILLGTWATAAMFNGEPLIPPGTSPNSVLVMMVNKLTSPVLGGFLTAGILAAIMSSLDSQFLCLGSIFTNDIYLHYKGKQEISEKKKVLVSRLFVVAVVLVTYLIACYVKNTRGIFTLGIWCFSGFAALVPLVIGALYWRRTTTTGAFACILAGAGSWLWLFAQSGYGANRGYLFMDMMPVATMVIVSTVTLIVVSLVTTPPDDKTLARFFTTKDGSGA